MVDIILILILAAVVGSASVYIYKAKKRGTKCIGCPAAGSCPSRSCGCGHSEQS